RRRRPLHRRRRHGNRRPRQPNRDPPHSVVRLAASKSRTLPQRVQRRQRGVPRQRHGDPLQHSGHRSVGAGVTTVRRAPGGESRARGGHPTTTWTSVPGDRAGGRDMGSVYPRDGREPHRSIPRYWFQSMTRRPHSDVFVGIASFGRRARMLEAAVESLLPQVDRIGVYLNDYPEIPSFLEHPRIDVEISADYGDLRDNGKFFFLGRTDHRFYAAADDDIHYPTDYIEVLKEALVDTGPNSAVAVHGAVYPTPILDMFTARHVFHFSESLQHVMPVHLVGTGTLLFDQSEWNLDFEEFGEPGMADVWFARSAKKRSARLFVVNRDRDWLRPVDSAGVAHSGGAIPTLY